MKFEIQRFAEDTAYLQENLRGFVPQLQATDIIRLAVRGSAILRLSRVEMLESESKKFPVMTKGVGAYWVDETERIRTSKAQWIYPEIRAKKLAVIIPVTREKLEDVTISVFEELKPYIAEAFSSAIDSACLFGKDSPFTRNFYDACLENEMAIAVGSNKDSNNKPQLDLDVSDVMALIETKGFDASAFIADISFKNSLRKLRDGNGNQLYFMGSAANLDYDTLYSLPIDFCRSSAWDKTKALCVCGDFKNYSIVGIREQIKYEILQEATLHTVTMADGKPLSLAEQDFIAIKATMRLGFLPVKEDAFAMLVPTGAATTAQSSGAGNATVQGGGSDLDGTDTNVTPSTP